MKILILGGTGFIGSFQVRYALSRGHEITVFNRGKSHRGSLPPEVEQLIGDRNGQLDALMGRKWDVVIDNPQRFPSGCAMRLKFLKARWNAMSLFRRFRSIQTKVGPAWMKADRYKNTKDLMKMR